MNKQYDRSPQKRKGFTLVEMMVAMTLALILSLGISQLFLSNKQTSTVTRNLGKMQDNLRTANHFLTGAIHMAGQWGGIENTRFISGSMSFSGIGSCNSQWVQNFSEGLRGYNGALTTSNVSNLPSGCLSNYLPNTDVLVVRYADSASMLEDSKLSAAGDKATIRTRIDANKGFTGRLFKASDGPPDSKSSATLNMPLRVDMYYLKRCSETLGNGNCANTVPALARITLSDLNVIDQVLVEGIENLQFEFGLDTNLTGFPNEYKAAHQVPNWRRVTSVRVAMMARSVQKDPHHQDSNTYHLSNDTSSFQPAESDRQFYRKLILQTVEIKNRT